MLPMFLAVIDQTIVATALPNIASDLRSVEWTSGIVVGYLIAATILSPVYGRLGDAFGRRRLLFIALGIFIVASVLCAAADSIGVLIAARILQGVGGSGLMSLSQALIGEAVRPRDRARFQGFLAGIAVTSNTLGPVVGGLLTQYFGWRSIFLVNVPFGLLAMLLLARLPVRNVPREPFQFDGMGLFLFALMVTSLLGALQELQRFDLAVPYIVVTLVAVSAVALVLLYRWEKRAPDPLLPLSLLRDRSIWRSDAMAACHGATLVALLTFLPIYFRTVHGSEAAEIGLLMAPMTIAIAVGSMLTGWIVGRTGHSAILPSFGMAATAITLILLGLVSPILTARGASLMLACAAFFMGSVMSVVQVTVQTAAGPSLLGRAASSVQLSRALGAALGTALVSLAIFTTISVTDPRAIAVFSAVLEAGPESLSSVSPELGSAVAAGIGTAFRIGFLIIATFAAISSVLAWTLPMRRID